MTIVGGEIIVENGRCTRINESDVIEEAEEAGAPVGHTRGAGVVVHAVASASLRQGLSSGQRSSCIGVSMNPEQFVELLRWKSPHATFSADPKMPVFWYSLTGRCNPRLGTFETILEMHQAQV